MKRVRLLVDTNVFKIGDIGSFHSFNNNRGYIRAWIVLDSHRLACLTVDECKDCKRQYDCGDYLELTEFEYVET